MAWSLLQLAFGMAVLIGSAEVLVRGAVRLAQALNVPTLVIGMTVIAVGTSAPEFIVSLNAGLSGAPGLAVGNVIGSNIANVVLILGCCCVLSPIRGVENVHRRDGVMLAVGTLVFAALCLQGELGLVSGGILFAMFLGFLASSYRQEAAAEDLTVDELLELEEVRPLSGPTAVIVLVVVASLAALIWGADLLVDASIAIARAYDVSEEIIGLTIIALGTSLPELAASAVAARRGHSDIAVGNVVGSNLFNILGIAGAVAMITPLPVVERLAAVDIWIMVGTTALVLPIMTGRWHPGCGAGVVFLLIYAGYIAYNAVEAGFIGA